MRLISIGLMATLLASAAHSGQTRDSLKLIAARYVEAQEAVYERGAGPAQLEALMSFYAPTYAYYHPQFGVTVTGLDKVRRGTRSHLGELAEAEIEIKGMLVNGDMISLALQENLTDLAGQRIERPRMTVLTIKEGRIVQRIDN